MITWLLTNTLTAALFAGLVWLVIRVSKPAPGIRHALWLIVLLKLISPVEFLWSVPVAVRPAPKSESTILTAEPTAKPDGPVYGLINEELFVVTMGEKLATTPEVATDNAEIERRTPSTQIETVLPAGPAEPEERWRLWILFVWLAGGLFTISRLMRDTYRFGRFAKLAKKAPESLNAEVALVAGRMGLRTPGVRMLAGLASPVMWCVGRPVLLWPADLDKQVTGEGRRAVIAHELAHLRRRDHWVRWLEMMVAVVHWWNPVFWLARQRLRADAELACDQWATTQADRRTYAEALLAVCMFQPRRRPAAAVGVLGEGKREMQERLTQIMRMSSPNRAAFAAKLFVVLFGLASIPALTLGQAPAPVETVAMVDFTELDDELRVIFADLDLQDGDLKASSDDESQLIQLRLATLQRRYETLVKSREQNREAVKKDEAVLFEKLAEARRSAQRHQELVQAAENQGRARADYVKSRLEAARTNPVGPPGASATYVAGSNGVKVIGPDGKEMTGVIVTIDGAMQSHIYRPVTVPTPSSPVDPAKSVPPGRATEQYGYANPVVPPRASQPVKPDMAACANCHRHSPKIDNNAKCSFVPGEALRSANTSSSTLPTMLSRATYQLPKGQAARVASLLNGMKNKAIEALAEGDHLIVTTTPDAQQVIGNFVRLMGDPAAFKALKFGRDAETQLMAVPFDTVSVFEKIAFDVAPLAYTPAKPAK